MKILETALLCAKDILVDLWALQLWSLTAQVWQYSYKAKRHVSIFPTVFFWIKLKNRLYNVGFEVKIINCSLFCFLTSLMFWPLGFLILFIFSCNGIFFSNHTIDYGKDRRDKKQGKKVPPVNVTTSKQSDARPPDMGALCI